MADKKKQNKTFATVCIPQNLSRRDYFSDTYTTVMTVNGEKRQMDVTHICMPFKADREKTVMDYYEISKQGMHELYTTLARCISNQANTTSYLNSKGVPSVMRILRNEVVNKNPHETDIYLVTEHLRPLKEVYFNGETTMLDIFNFGCRTAKLIRDIHAQSHNANVTIRAIDPDQIFVDNDGRFVFGCFQYAYTAGSNKKPIPIAETAPFHVDGKVVTGSVGDLGTDMANLASILWGLLNGDGFEMPIQPGSPQYATPQMEKVLTLGMTGDPELFPQFKKELDRIFNEIKKDGISDIKIPVHQSKPCFEVINQNGNFGVATDVNLPEHHEETAPVPTETPQEPAQKPEDAQTAAQEPAQEQEPEEAQEAAPEYTQAQETTQPEILAEPAEAVPERETEPKPAMQHGVMEHEAEPEAEPTSEQEPEAEPAMQPAATAGESADNNHNEELEEAEEDEILQPERISVLDTTEYMEKTESACEMEPQTYEEGMQFEVLYNKPKFFLHQLLVLLEILAVIGGIIYLSVITHLISIW